MASASRAALAEALAGQPPWSDLPLLVLTRPGADSSEVEDAVRTLGNVTLLERPMRVSALMSAVRTAVRARERQYQIRGHMAERVRAEESLLAADQRKDEFLATLGHELRNPLAPILTSLQLLKLSTFTDQRSLRACAVMERQVNHLVRLVDDLLEVSRITRGVIEVRKETLDLVAVLRTAVETSRPLLEAARQALSVDIPDAVIPISGDTVRLTQVFANLLNNAAKYTQANGRIWLSAAKRERMGGRVGARQRHRHPAFAPDERVRHVHAGRSVPSPRAGRARHRPDAGAEPRSAARRDASKRAAEAARPAASSSSGCRRPPSGRIPAAKPRARRGFRRAAS